MRKLLFMAAVALSVACCTNKNINQPIEAPASVLQDLPGNYTFKAVVDSSTRYSTAVITETAKGEYQISRVTVYGPVLYGFTLGEHASVTSEELGTGAVTYQRGIKKTTIRFEQGGSVCELSK